MPAGTPSSHGPPVEVGGKLVYRPRRVRARLPSPSPGFRYRTRVHRLVVDAGATGGTIGLLHPSCALRVSDNSAEETANLFSSRSIARKFLTLALSVGCVLLNPDKSR